MSTVIVYPASSASKRSPATELRRSVRHINHKAHYCTSQNHDCSIFHHAKTPLASCHYLSCAFWGRWPTVRAENSMIRCYTRLQSLIPDHGIMRFNSRIERLDDDHLRLCHIPYNFFVHVNSHSPRAITVLHCRSYDKAETLSRSGLFEVY